MFEEKSTQELVTDPNICTGNIYVDGTTGTYSTGIDFNVTTNQNTMKQVKVAVFTIERNEDNQITSTKLLKELWVQVKNNTSLDLLVAKELGNDFDPETTVVREIYSLSF
jgi:hypothetical protein